MEISNYRSFLLILTLTQTQIFALKLIENLTQILILILKKQIKNGQMNILLFLFYCL